MKEDLKSNLLLQYPKLFDSRGRVNSNLMRDIEISNKIREIIKDYFINLQGDYLLSEKLVILFNDISLTSNMCKICKTYTALDTVKKVFRSYCSSKCAHKDESLVEKVKKTCIDRYGVTSNLVLPITHQKLKEKYGGVGMSSTIIKNKIKKTINKKYGVDNVFQLPEIIEKIKNTHKTKYEGKLYSQQHITDEILLKLNDFSFCESITKDDEKSFSDYAYEIGVTPTTLLKYIKKHNLPIIRKSKSAIEREISDWLTNCGIIFSKNDRSTIPNSEVDIYIPEYKLAIELNGLYWHSDSNIDDRHYHYKKYKKYSDINIHVMSFWEHETTFKLDIVKSMILNKCNRSIKIGARKCNIVELDHKSKTEFFNNNHLSGDSMSSVSYGLVYNNQVVCAMSLMKSRFDNKHEYEIIRYANILNHTIVGGLSRLFKYAIDKLNIKSCISYADIQFSKEGNAYKKCGFEYDGTTNVGYFYFKNTPSGEFKILSRYMAQKHKLKGILNTFSENMTEYDNMINNGWYRVWDMGNHRLVWKSS